MDEVKPAIVTKAMETKAESKRTFGASVKANVSAGTKKFINRSGVPVSIGVKNKTLTWTAWEVLELREDEYNDPNFKRRINDFKEVK